MKTPDAQPVVPVPAAERDAWDRAEEARRLLEDEERRSSAFLEQRLAERERRIVTALAWAA